MATRTPDGAVVICTTLRALRRTVARGAPAVLRVDPSAPEVRSPSSVRAVRELAERHAVVVQLTRDDDAREIALLAAGVDVARADSSLAALAARVARPKALRLGARQVLRLGPLELDAMTACVSVAGVDAHVSPQEFRVLHALVRAGGELVSRAALLRAIGCPRDPGYDLLGTAVHRLRGALGSARDLIHVERGRGIRLRVSASVGLPPPPEILSVDEKCFPLPSSARAWLAEQANAKGPPERPPPPAKVRAQMLLALDEQRSTAEVAADSGRTERNVRQLRARYLARGITCIFDATRVGRPTRRA